MQGGPPGAGREECNGLLLRTHGREEDHVADGMAVGKQHHHAVDTDTQTRGRR